MLIYYTTNLRNGQYLYAECHKTAVVLYLQAYRVNNTSKQILNIRLNNYMKNEKSFLLFNDNINKLNKIFNI